MDLVRSQIEDLTIENNSAVGACRRKATQFAEQLGFDSVKVEEIAISVTELVMNVLIHGGGKGHFVICRIQNGHTHNGLEIWCCDYGNGISDPFQAARDGYSSINSLGIGIGSIQRLADEFEINIQKLPLPVSSMFHRSESAGNCMCFRKWLADRKWVSVNRYLVIGAALRAKPGEMFNGDDYAICHLFEGITVAAVIDGLGHGKEAHLASQLAKERILSKPNLPLDALLNYIHASIRGTRGATIGLVRLDSNSGKLLFIGVGNIEGQVIAASKSQSLTSLGGIVGHNMRTPRVFEYEYKTGDNLILHSDGISSSWISCDRIFV